MTTSVSVRVRITATVALLVLAGLVLAGAVVYTIESRRLEQQIASSVDQEFAEFGKLQSDGVNPDTGRPFETPEDMVRLFFQRNVPGDNELLIGWWNDRIGAQSPRQDAISESDWIGPTVRSLLDDNGTTTVDSEFGELQVATQAVRQGDETGALVVVTFLDRVRSGLRDTMRTYAIVAALVLLVVTAVAFWVSGRLLSPLRTLRETAEDITETDLSQRLPVTGNDDITALTRTFNGMLDRLEAAFVGQRQFLDDAGHELKTPLTVLRGHLELLDSDNPADVAETRLLLLDEIDRMSRLVGDLILLAKSDRPDFLRLRQVDLDGLTNDLVAKARGLGDRDWVVDEVAEAKVVADEQRLTQAVLQLADNAVKHTHAGDTIAIGSSATPTQVRIWVRDTGPGVPPEDRELVFERFGRSAVPPGDEGFGLGLSIVGAIVRAHGGTVAVEDADPPGARFVVTLSRVRKMEDEWPAS
ncbi:HAMP domain-containing histidine kinase [Nocardioides sp. LMS-CY]|uniref:sensor histidine kinase n=1 Tax=Nocardioides sp. (strain LMS-CY) TaxID=2840457 RepID=UPI001C008CFC|nr:ATP-binding protein [Nocardioides sp. LMS-CY]QWF20618.1 HAMP domain-containing histidine kinase [Nocardioides sp. LMS-CY]